MFSAIKKMTWWEVFLTLVLDSVRQNTYEVVGLVFRTDNFIILWGCVIIIIVEWSKQK